MALESTPPLSIKYTEGLNRSIAFEVDGNITGNKSLLTLGGNSGKLAPVSMLSFLGYSAPFTINFMGDIGTGGDALFGNLYLRRTSDDYILQNNSINVSTVLPFYINYTNLTESCYVDGTNIVVSDSGISVLTEGGWKISGGPPLYFDTLITDFFDSNVSIEMKWWASGGGPV